MKAPHADWDTFDLEELVPTPHAAGAVSLPACPDCHTTMTACLACEPHLQAVTLVLQSLQPRQGLVPQLQQASVGVVLHDIPVHHSSAFLKACRQSSQDCCAASTICAAIPPAEHVTAPSVLKAARCPPAVQKRFPWQIMSLHNRSCWATGSRESRHRSELMLCVQL